MRCTEVATPPHARVVPSRPWLRARLPLIFWPLLEFFMAPPLLGGEHEWTSGGLERFSFSVVVLGKLFYGSNIELGRRGHICVAYGSDDSSFFFGRRTTKKQCMQLARRIESSPNSSAIRVRRIINQDYSFFF